MHYDHFNENHLVTPRKLSELYDSDRITLEGKSLFCFSHKNCLRKIIGSVANSKVFNLSILFLIIVSTITLALDSPLEDPNGSLTIILKYVDYGMTLVFTLEALIKIISFGFLFNGESSYLRNPWNLLDFLIVLAA